MSPMDNESERKLSHAHFGSRHFEDVIESEVRAIGDAVVRIFKLQRTGGSQEHFGKDYPLFQTTWGPKTNLGIGYITMKIASRLGQVDLEYDDGLEEAI